MTPITRVHLENEMDLILAHKQTMKLAELCGISLPMQTTLATAVSELSRAALECGHHAMMQLQVSEKTELPKQIAVAVQVTDAAAFNEQCEGYVYARKLVRNISLKRSGPKATAELLFGIPGTTRIDAEITDRWRRYLNTDPDVSPYEEIKRKNRQLQDLANKLRDSEQQYKELTDSLPLMIYTMDEHGRLLFANKWLLEYTGHTQQQINDTKWQELLLPEDFAAVWDNISRLSAGDFDQNAEHRLRHHESGAFRWHTGTITPVLNAAGEAMYWSVFMADNQAQKETEAILKDNRELRETKILLEQKVAALDVSNKQLEQFAYIASHDLQEPLRKIIYFSDYLQKRHANSLDKDAQGILQRMMDATGRMKMLISDVLAYSMIPDENKVWDRVDLNTTVREVLQELDIMIGEKGAQIVTGALPVIDGNTIQMRQMFSNIVNNSLKYSDPARPLLISIDGTVTDGTLTLCFRDNGIGFEDQYMPKMFSLFQRLHTRDQYSGTGIGLAICKKIAELHYGSITASGEPGAGATFIIRVPVTQNG